MKRAVQPAGKKGKRKAPTITEVVTDDDALAPLLWDDVKRVFAALLVGCAAAAIGEYVATLVTAPGRVAFGTALRFLLLDLGLFGVVYVVLAPLVALVAVGARLALLADSGERARGFRGLLAPARAESQPVVANWLWGAALAAALYLASSALMTVRVWSTFKEPQLAAALLAGLQLGLLVLCAVVAWGAAALLIRLGRRVDDLLGHRFWLNPFGHPTAAAAALLLVGLPASALALLLMPQMGPLVPWRHLVCAGLLALGAHAATYVFARRGALLPRSPRPRLAALGGLLFAAALILPVSLVAVGADPATKSLAVSASPPLGSVVDLLRRATDFDRDGYGTLLGENDCAPLDGAVHPLARDLPDNGVDENCDGRDFELGRVPSYRRGQRMPVPEGFRRQWNVLLVTVDTVRYDHTTMGGYKERTGRQTTPELAELAARSVSFTFANAPSAGTMASVPAILTSKFFHSGIALDEKNVKRGWPPRLKEQNVLVSELFDAAGYRTGAILTHEWFGDWGLKQGWDSYDNLVPRSEPFVTAADRTTDAALAWIGQKGDDRWFLWLHYIDPHGRYVPHPGETSFGTSEEDLYDGELAFTDKQLGRLVEELGRMPGADRTVIAVTSDHGDGFNEHGFINHGQALYRELLHVPLIVYVPNITPREVGGAVSPLDILPTLIDLCRLDARGLELEGESLVPQLFYGQDASDRVVFAETNAQRTLRAAVSGQRKLIYDLKANVYELYDLVADPWEQRNLWPGGDRAGFEEMKGYLDDWLERVYYARDPTSNQAMAKIADHLLAAAPDPSVRVDGASLDGAAIQVLGFDSDKPSYRAGDKAELSVYFRAARRPSGDFLFQIEAWRKDAAGGAPARSSMKATAGGLLPSSRWRGGEHIRDRIKVRLPESWADPAGGPIVIGLRAQTASGRKPAPFKGPTRAGQPDVLVLGQIRLDPGAKPKN
jgi:choline-sulfatase